MIKSSHTSKTTVYDLNLFELTTLVQSWGEPAYCAGQIWQGLYKNLWQTPEEFSNLPKALRDKMAENLRFDALIPTLKLDSSDGQTRKTLFRLPDGRQIEAVLMRYDPSTGSGRGRRTLCISTQVGCAMGCTFCATGQMGFTRHLSSGEIVAQVMYYARLLHDKQDVVTNVVLMGMGEPFHNYDNTMAAIDRLNHPQGYNFGFAWALINGVNDTPEVAEKLSALLKGLLCHVNAIPLNPTTGYTGQPTTRARADAFKKILDENGIPCTIRIRRGIDIQAGCGQLASRASDENLISG